jgi:hypothetical protein
VTAIDRQPSKSPLPFKHKSSSKDLGDATGRDVNCVGLALGDLTPPWSIPADPIPTVSDARREPGDVDEAAPRRPQPDGEKVLVEDGQRLLLKMRETLGVETTVECQVAP